MQTSLTYLLPVIRDAHPWTRHSLFPQPGPVDEGQVQMPLMSTKSKSISVKSFRNKDQDQFHRPGTSLTKRPLLSHHKVESRPIVHCFVKGLYLPRLRFVRVTRTAPRLRSLEAPQMSICRLATRPLDLPDKLSTTKVTGKAVPIDGCGEARRRRKNPRMAEVETQVHRATSP